MSLVITASDRRTMPTGAIAVARPDLVLSTGFVPPADLAANYDPSNAETGFLGPSAFDHPSVDLFCRACDICGALILLLFIAPLWLALAGLIWAEDRGPVLYKQRRIGRGGAPFECYKFRSMVLDADAQLDRLLRTDAAARTEWASCHKLHRDPRITRIGEFLRRSSLDELPQLLHVVTGKMSLVGPRPIVVAEIGRYGHRIAAYYAVRPGITGLWQVSGRSETTYRRRVALDVLYVRRRSPLLYLWLLLTTVPAVLLQKGSC